MAELRVGQTLGQYVLVGVLGRGGMATVYKARQSNPDRFVALKALASELVGEPEFVARFRHEANIAASVDHPNVVPIYSVGEEGGHFYIAMRLVPGETLAAVIRRDHRLGIERTRKILRQIADALDYAHQRGIVHRDLKPSNVMVEEGDRVTLTDFGIARARDETVVARTHGVIGTPHYMAPEQALGESVDYRADLYALGIVAYEMLAGRVPYEADTPLAVLHRQVYDATPSICADYPDLPPSLDLVLGKMLAKKPEERYASATEFVDALDEVSRTTTPFPGVVEGPTRPMSPVAPAGDRNGSSGRRPPRTVTLAVGAIAVVVLALIPTVGLHLVGGNPPAVVPSVTATAPSTAVIVTPTNSTSVLQPVNATATPTLAASSTSVPSPAALVASPTATVKPSPTRPALPAGIIVFTSDNPADRGLYAISPTGENLHQIASGETHNPACSPDGSSVAFELKRAGNTFVYVQRLAGSGSPEAVTKGPGADQLPAWTPDGKSIAFSRATTNNTAIFSVDLASHQEHRLTSGEGGDWRMGYSPDGKQIVFTSTRSGNNELWIMNADGSNAHQLTSGPGDKRDPAWSPDGKSIAFRSDRDGHHWDLYKVSPGDGKIVRLTNDSNDKGAPNWSPDSRWILFAAKRGGTTEVYVMPVDGGAWTPITEAPTIGGGPTWCRAVPG